MKSLLHAFFNGYCIVKGCYNEAVTNQLYCLDHLPRWPKKGKE